MGFVGGGLSWVDCFMILLWTEIPSVGLTLENLTYLSLPTFHLTMSLLLEILTTWSSPVADASNVLRSPQRRHILRRCAFSSLSIFFFALAPRDLP